MVRIASLFRPQHPRGRARPVGLRPPATALRDLARLERYRRGGRARGAGTTSKPGSTSRRPSPGGASWSCGRARRGYGRTCCSRTPRPPICAGRKRGGDRPPKGEGDPGPRASRTQRLRQHGARRGQARCPGADVFSGRPGGRGLAGLYQRLKGGGLRMLVAFEPVAEVSAAPSTSQATPSGPRSRHARAPSSAPCAAPSPRRADPAGAGPSGDLATRVIRDRASWGKVGAGAAAYQLGLLLL